MYVFVIAFIFTLTMQMKIMYMMSLHFTVHQLRLSEKHISSSSFIEFYCFETQTL